MKIFLTCLFSLAFGFQTVFSQEEGVEIPAEQLLRARQQARLYGKVLDTDNKGMPAATVEVYMKRKNAGIESSYDSLIAGTLTKNNGDFTFVNFNMPDSFSLNISNMGYAFRSQVVKLSAANKSVKSTAN